MSMLIIAMVMVIAMIAAACHAVLMEKRREAFRLLKAGRPGHFVNTDRD